jgi:hypothetical protein
MGLVVATTLGSIIWLIAWAQGLKSFDGFLIGAGIVLVALLGRMILPLLPGNRSD